MTEIRKRHWFGIHWAWVVLGSSFTTLFINYSIRIGAYSVLLPEMIKEYQMTKAQAGMIERGNRLKGFIFFMIGLYEIVDRRFQIEKSKI